MFSFIPVVIASVFVIPVFCIEKQKVGVLIVVDEDQNSRLLSDRVKTTINDEIKELNLEAETFEWEVSLDGKDRQVNRLFVTKELVCRDLLNSSIAIFLVQCTRKENSAALAVFSAVGYALGFYRVPVIGVMVKDAQFSRKNVYPTFLRTSPPFSNEAFVFVHLLNALKYHQVVVITVAEDVNGQEFVQVFDSLSIRNKIQIQKHIEIEDANFNLTESLKGTTSNTIILYAKTSKAFRIFNESVELFVKGRVWLVNEAGFKADNVPRGVLSVRLRQTVLSSLRDALAVLRNGLEIFDDFIEVRPPSQCKINKNNEWINNIGQRFYDKMITSKVHSDYHDIEFDGNGDRTEASYDVLNHHADGDAIVGFMTHYGNLSINESSIVWPGDSLLKPQEITLPKNLKAVTVPDPPFTYSIPVAEKSQCKYYKTMFVEGGHVPGPWTPCTKKENLTYTSYHCCAGFAIDLLVQLSSMEAQRDATFEFELHLNDTYGGPVVTEDDLILNGMIGELDIGLADLAIGALSINPEREKYVDFSEPWLFHGIRVLEKWHPRDSPMESFLQPLKKSLWGALFVSVLVIGCIIYLLDWRSPFNIPYQKDIFTRPELEDTPVSFGEAMWFVWGVLLNSGVSEKTPRSFSARVLGIVWCGFCMIMVASYTANLAAFLVLDQPDKSLNGINDPKFRNPSINFSFGTVIHSNTYQYFKRQVELSTMFRKMESHNYKTAQEAINALLNESLGAFIWDSARLDFEASKNCDLRARGTLFGRSAYGIALRKNSPWTPYITSRILKLAETGDIQKMESKWIGTAGKEKCHHEIHKTPARLGLQNMRDLFILVAVGVVVGSILSFFEVQIGRKKLKEGKRKRLAFNYAQRWRLRARQQSADSGALKTIEDQQQDPPNRQTRSINLDFNERPCRVYCSRCRKAVTTIPKPVVGGFAMFCTVLLVVTFLWPCAIFPCILRAFADYLHYCPICSHTIGQYRKFRSPRFFV
uniref:LITAF domain-containing protein n=1 Tax=Bursaphelenchus xylophilus TaxID=6326 RepID=A0A1I7SWT2_BURXY